MVTKQRKAINKEIGKFLKPIYFPQIPLDALFDIIETHGFLVVDEEGNRWSGFLCGREGIVYFDIVSKYDRKPAKYRLNLQWYKMDHSGNYEITAYVG
jgi:hypothetical protein